MPELPDIEVYVDCLRPRVVGRTLTAMKFRSPFLLRTALPPWKECEGREVTQVRRLAKRIVFGLSGDRFLVLHLMRLGRLQWRDPGQKALAGKILLAALELDEAKGEGGTLFITEAGTKKRASLHIVEGEAAVAEHDRGGIDPLTCTVEEFAAAIKTRNHTIKRALTDPRYLSGIGNAYSDEILHAAKLSPVKQTHKLGDDEIATLHAATQQTLRDWTTKLREEVGDGWPKKVTAFRPDMAVHGKYGEPCPVCEAPVQRIVYATRETNYCAKCQNGGRRLADRGLSRLLGKDWPRTLEELEEIKK